MLKKAFLLMLILLMTVTTVIPALVGATTASVTSGAVRIHYLRTDFTYTGWGLHRWGDNYPKQDWKSPLAATGMDEYGPYWDVPYSTGELNFIVHNGDDKEYTERSFPAPVAGKEIWVYHGDASYYETAATALTAAGITAMPAIADGNTRIYYLRPDKIYTGWGLHGWTAAGPLPGVSWGTPLPIAGLDKYGYAYWDVPSNISGYIIHKGETKDTEHNRAIDTSNNENFVVSGDAANYTDRLTAMDKAGSRISQATLTGMSTIKFTTTLAIDASAEISVTDGTNTIAISATDRASEPTYTITLATEVDLTKTYQIVVDSMSAYVAIAPELIDSHFGYSGKLGAIYSATGTTFKLWAPVASDVKLLFYASNSSTTASTTTPMTKDANGVWSCTVSGDLAGQLYQYQVTNAGATKLVLDPYAVSMAAFDSASESDKVGKAAVIDLSKTNPDYWKKDHYVKLNNPEDAILYEVHVRDFTIADTSVAAAKRGTYEGFIAKIPYLKQLGVTHVQLQPIQNWYYGNESKQAYESGMATKDCNYNWGYDPHNYNTPEGWFSSNPSDPYARVRELKHLIKELHSAGIGVVLDVVYNHTAVSSIFEDIVPNYYYRRNADGSFANGSGCANDTASERAMYRKFMIDSAMYWVKEYHVDGFRFDLMGLHDITTMKQLAFACRAINPYTELHGEGWDMGTLPLHDRYCKGGSGSGDDYHRALLEISRGISHFSDGMRDGLIQKNYQTPTIGGFVQNDTSYVRDHEAFVRRGIVANMAGYTTSLPINDAKYDNFCDDPEESVNFDNCHDGLTINDKLKLTLPSAVSTDEFTKRYKLQCAIIMTSQGKAFFQAGEELFRSKPATDTTTDQSYIASGYCSNSHDASDDINKIDWLKFQAQDPGTMDLHDFYAGMIQLRKAHRAFRMETLEMVQKNLAFINEDISGLIAYRIRRADGKERWNDIIVIFNSTSTLQTVTVPGVNLTAWQVVVDGDRVNLDGITNASITLEDGKITVPPISAIVIHAPVVAPTAVGSVGTADEDVTNQGLFKTLDQKVSENESLERNKLQCAVAMTAQDGKLFEGSSEVFANMTKLDLSKLEGLDSYYAGLIALHENHAAFTMETDAMIQSNITFINEGSDNLCAYRIRRMDGQESWKDIIVIYNANSAGQTVCIPGVDLANWQVVVDNQHSGVTPIQNSKVIMGNDSITVPGISVVVIHAPVK